MENKEKALSSILTPSLRLFLAGEMLINFSDMYILFLPLFMSDLGASVVEIGLIYSLSDVVPLALNIIGGWLSDQFGRIKTITWGNLLKLFSFAVMIFVDQWQWMILVFSLIGIGWALGGPSFAAYIADHTADENRAKVYAVQLNLRNAVNLVKFPLAGLLVARFGFRMMILAAALLFIFGTIVLAVLERRPDQKIDLDQVKNTPKPFGKSIGLIFSLLLAGGLFTWMFIIDHANDIFVGLSNSFQFLYFEDVVGVSIEQIGFIPMIGSLVALLVTIPLGSWVDKKGENVGLGLAHFLLAFFFATPLLARNFLGLIPSALIHPFMIGLAVPASKSLISKTVPAEQRGIAFGLTSTSRGLFSLPAPYLGGLLWDRFSPGTPFLITAIGCLGLSCLAFWKLKIPKGAKKNIS